MKLALVVLILAVAVCTAVASVESDFQTFQTLMFKYNRIYDSPAELAKRFSIFQENAQRLATYRALHFAETGETGEDVLDFTKFFDVSRTEFATQYLNRQPSPGPINAAVFNGPIGAAPPTTVDWRTKGAVTDVKDQGQCGSCWAFSATEGIESAWFLAGNKLTALSPQQIVSCDTTDSGCDGGDLPTAYAYVKQAGGLESDAVYPYTSGTGDQGTCKFKKANVVAHISNFTYATPPCQDSCNKQNETLLAINVAAVGPSSICVDAEPWQFYSGGVFTGSGCGHAYSDLDHCVQIVGYNAAGSAPYWIVRNSWNTDWGISGYIYLAMNKNVCGVADEATFVQI